MLKKLAFIVLLLSAATFAFGEEAADKLSVRAFQLRYKQADRAAAIAKPLMSSDGTLSIQPASNTLTVTDHAGNVRNIAAVMQKFDAPPRPFALSLRLVSASRNTNPSPVPDDLKDVAAKLSGILGFNSFQKLGELNVEGREGDPIVSDAGSGYRAEFKFGDYDPASDSVRLTDFKLSRLEGKDQVMSLLKTTLNLKTNQMVVLGASRNPDSQRALMLVLVAKPVAAR